MKCFFQLEEITHYGTTSSNLRKIYIPSISTAANDSSIISSSVTTLRTFWNKAHVYRNPPLIIHGLHRTLASAATTISKKPPQKNNWHINFKFSFRWPNEQCGSFEVNSTFIQSIRRSLQHFRIEILSLFLQKWGGMYCTATNFRLQMVTK